MLYRYKQKNQTVAHINKATTQQAQTSTRIKVTEKPGVSIKGILNNENIQKEEQIKTSISSSKTKLFNQNELSFSWKEYIKTIPEKKIIVSTMQNCIPILKENFHIELVVDNQIQEKEIEAESIDILNFLIQKLENGNIKLIVRIAENGENKKSLSARDRLLKMIENNSNLELLRTELDLELD